MYHVIDSRFRNIKINSITVVFFEGSLLSFQERLWDSCIYCRDGSSPNKYTSENMTKSKVAQEHYYSYLLH